MQEILELDFEIFHFINATLSNSVFDFLLPILREKITWIPFYLFLAYFLISRFSKNGLIIFLVGCITVGLADFTSSTLIKKNVKRLRPCNVEQPLYPVVERVHCGGGYSFTSSHAANHFSLAVFLILAIGRRFRWIKWPLISWAATISFSQIYVGVHFPLDILFGGILGSILAWIVFSTLAKFLPHTILRRNYT